MQDFLKDHGEWLIGGFAYLGTILLGVLGLGKLMQRVTELESASAERKLLCPNLMTITRCEDRQAKCQELQTINHGHVIERLDALQLSQSDAVRVHTDQNNMIMEHLMNKGNK